MLFIVCILYLTSCTVHIDSPNKSHLQSVTVFLVPHPSRSVPSSWSTCAWWSSPPSSLRLSSGNTSWCRSKGHSACHPPPWPAWLSPEIATRRSSSSCATSSARLRGDRQLSTTSWGANPRQRQLEEAGATGVVEETPTESGIIPGTQKVSRRATWIRSICVCNRLKVRVEYVELVPLTLLLP